jgi:hypothetical protein
MKPVKLGPFPLGMDNRAEDVSLKTGDGIDLLRLATNVDVTNAGKIRRRAGFTAATHVPQVNPQVSLPITASHAVSGSEVLTNDQLRDLMNPQPRELSCKSLGRYISAVADMLYWSDLYLDGDELGNGAKTTSDRNFMPFPAPITAVFSTGSGIYVSADKTYFLDGDVQSAAANPVHPSVILKGSVSKAPLSESFVWLSTRGVMTGTQGGEVGFLSNKHVDTGYLKPTQTGATLYRDIKGVRQVIAILHGDKLASGIQHTDYMDMEVIQKGVNYGH